MGVTFRKSLLSLLAFSLIMPAVSFGASITNSLTCGNKYKLTVTKNADKAFVVDNKIYVIPGETYDFEYEAIPATDYSVELPSPNPKIVTDCTIGSDAQQSILGESGDRASLPGLKMVGELSQSKDEENVKRLQEIFSSHTLQEDDKVDSFLDAEVLLALHKIATKEAHVALRKTLQDIRDRGPKHKSSAWHDERYMASMSTGIRLLGVSAEEDDRKLLAELADNEKLDGSLREQAYFWILIQKMNDRSNDSLREKIEWLYLVYMREGGKAIPAYKSVAIERIIYRMGEDILPVLIEYADELLENDEYINELPKSTGGNAWVCVWLKHLADNLAAKVAKEETFEIPGKAYWRAAADDNPNETRPTVRKPVEMLPAND